MRTVRRTTIPTSLENNSETWKAQLIAELQSKPFKSVSKSLVSRYKQEDVKRQLKRMYKEKCCYCETHIGVGGYEHIEHLKPKSLPAFHQYTYDWNNLHWSCEKCNKKKGSQWNDRAPILDPTLDNIHDHLEFEVITGLITEKDHSSRAKTTIKHTDLNRKELVTARQRLLDKAIECLHELLSTETPYDEQVFITLIKTFLQQDHDSYPTYIEQMIQFIEDEYLNESNNSTKQ